MMRSILFALSLFWLGIVSPAQAETQTCFQLDSPGKNLPAEVCLDSVLVDFPAFSLQGEVKIEGQNLKGTFSAERELAGEDQYLVRALLSVREETERACGRRTSTHLILEVYTTEDDAIVSGPALVGEIQQTEDWCHSKEELQERREYRSLQVEKLQCFVRSQDRVSSLASLPAEVCLGSIQAEFPALSGEGEVTVSGNGLVAGKYRAFRALAGEDVYEARAEVLKSVYRENGCSKMQVARLFLILRLNEEGEIVSPIELLEEISESDDACHLAPEWIQSIPFLKKSS